MNSFITLLNARYYMQANIDVVESSTFHIHHSIYHPNEGYSGHRVHHSIYRPELHIDTLKDEKLQALQKDMSKCPDNEVLHITRPIQAAMPPWVTVGTMEMDSFLLA
ncbi:hypothetical protein EDB19DRAFT_1832676 [Suillus lakei]|nr:hypothetical protein EDB19DRAFT_1832676 [Suillus lakei]